MPAFSFGTNARVSFGTNPIFRQAMEILAHVNKRVRGAPGLRLPLKELLELASDPRECRPYIYSPYIYSPYIYPQ